MTREAASALAHLDCSTGVSGDKFLGALLDAGEADGSFTAEHLREVASSFAPEAVVEVGVVQSHGVRALTVKVTATGEPPSRSWRDIRAAISDADLALPVREKALRAFTLLAEAEADTHGCAVEDVHFHEVGSIDSIVDIVGTCAGLHALGIGTLIATPVAIGSGIVSTSHGMLAVPAPATARLLVGIPVLAGTASGELTTPTGATLLRACVTAFGPCPPMIPEAVGYGAGTRDIGEPNVCRLIVGAPASATVGHTAEKVAVLETNVDHLSGESVGFAIEQLMAEGALDAWATPITMKKSRPALLLSALVDQSQAEGFSARVMSLTGTLGVRRTDLERYAAARELREIDTDWGTVRVKVGAGMVRPEAADVARIAALTSQPFSAVEALLREIAEEALRGS